MSITTFSELKTAVLNWSERSDLSTVVDDFITMAESRFNKELRLREMEAQDDLTPSSGSVTLPADFLEVIRVKAKTTPARVLEYVTPGWADDAYPTATVSGYGSFYTLIGSTLKTYPQVSSDIELTYYQKITALSDSNTSNWLLAKAPDVYLFGTLVELAIYNNDERLAVWGQTLDRAIGALKMADAYAKSGTPVRRSSVATAP